MRTWSICEEVCSGSGWINETQPQMPTLWLSIQNSIGFPVKIYLINRQHPHRVVLTTVIDVQEVIDVHIFAKQWYDIHLYYYDQDHHMIFNNKPFYFSGRQKKRIIHLSQPFNRENEGRSSSLFLGPSMQL